MSKQPPAPPPAGGYAHGTAWGHGYNPSATTTPGGDKAWTGIGSHERVGMSPSKAAIAQAGEKGIKPPGGPKGMNAPPKGKR
jgi:hypothetical protein